MNRLKQVRKEKKLTLFDLSRKLDIPISTLSRYENGDNDPKINTWIKTADALKVTTTYLIGLDEDVKTGDWEEKLTCPYCKVESVYEVYHELEGNEGVISLCCDSCEKYFEVDYYPVIEFKVRET